ESHSLLDGDGDWWISADGDLFRQVRNPDAEPVAGIPLAQVSRLYGIDTAGTKPRAVAPELIEQQREKGWPDFHPEDYCHKCGDRIDPNWCASREDWTAATSVWAQETGREGICCIRCFAGMLSEATG